MSGLKRVAVLLSLSIAIALLGCGGGGGGGGGGNPVGPATGSITELNIQQLNRASYKIYGSKLTAAEWKEITNLGVVTHQTTYPVFKKQLDAGLWVLIGEGTTTQSFQVTGDYDWYWMEVTPGTELDAVTSTVSGVTSTVPGGGHDAGITGGFTNFRNADGAPDNQYVGLNDVGHFARPLDIKGSAATPAVVTVTMGTAPAAATTTLVGTWVSGTSSVTLNSEGTFSTVEPGGNYSGVYKANDTWLSSLTTGDSETEYFPYIIVGNTLYLYSGDGLTTFTKSS